MGIQRLRNRGKNGVLAMDLPAVPILRWPQERNGRDQTSPQVGALRSQCMALERRVNHLLEAEAMASTRFQEARSQFQMQECKSKEREQQLSQLEERAREATACEKHVCDELRGQINDMSQIHEEYSSSC